VQKRASTDALRNSELQAGRLTVPEWRFRNIDTGKVITIKAKDIGAAWKKMAEDYSDPLHAWQDWASMD
jgi:hypothetical protein